MPDPMSRSHSTEWGLASLIPGGILIIATALGFQLILWLEMNHFQNISRSDFKPMAYGGYACAGLLALVAFLSFCAGIISMMVAKREERPMGLGLFGMLVSFIALGMCVAAGIAWHSSVVGRM